MASRKLSINELLNAARLLEAEGKADEAIKAYSSVTARDPLRAAAYNRLMILYRKQKQYGKELAIIKQAVAAYETDIKEDQQSWKKANAKLARLSQSLAKSLGLLTEKGLPVYEEPYITTWRRRMETVQKKMESTPRSPKKNKRR